MSDTQVNSVDNIPGLNLVDKLASNEEMSILPPTLQKIQTIEVVSENPVTNNDGEKDDENDKVCELIGIKDGNSEHGVASDHESSQGVSNFDELKSSEEVVDVSRIKAERGPERELVDGEENDAESIDNGGAISMGGSTLAKSDNEEADSLDRALAGEHMCFSSDEEGKSTVAINTDRQNDSPHSSHSESDFGLDSDSDSGSESASEDKSDFDDSDSNRRKRKSGNNDLSDDEDNDQSGPLRTKNEIVDIPAPAVPSDFHLTKDMPIQFVGELTQVVERSAIIKAAMSGEFRILGDDSIFCFEDRQVLGVLFETFGRVQAPVYSVKFNTDEEAKALLSRKGQKVYYVVPASSFIFTETVRSIKGSDASNWHDEEVSEGEQEFSDDEKELESKASKKKKRKRQHNKSQEADSNSTSNSNQNNSNPREVNLNRSNSRNQRQNHRNHGPTQSYSRQQIGQDRQGHSKNPGQYSGMPYYPQQQAPNYYPPMPWLPQQYTPNQFNYGLPMPPLPNMPGMPMPPFSNIPVPPPPMDQGYSVNHQYSNQFPMKQYQNQAQRDSRTPDSGLPYGNDEPYVP